MLHSCGVGFCCGRDYLRIPVLTQLLEIIGGLAVIPLMPGAPLGVLSLNAHSTAFMVLALMGDVVFYSFIAHKLMKRRYAAWGTDA
jgi:hypothetical protein